MERDIGVPARAIGDPGRSRMLTALLGGSALSAGELARVAGVAPSTGSGHLAALLDAGLVAAHADGRHRLYRLAGPEVARALEALQLVAPAVPVRSLSGRRIADDLVAGRTCYDHVAGDLGLRIADLLVRAGVIGSLAAGEVQTELRTHDHPVSRALGLERVVPGRRPLVRGCADWSGRRAHVGGALGTHLLSALTGRGWVRRRPGSRAVTLTGPGHEALSAWEATA